jgi:hypothetical protein
MRHAEGGRVGLYQGYFFIADIVGLPQEAEVGSRIKKEEDSADSWEPQYRNRRWAQSL